MHLPYNKNNKDLFGILQKKFKIKIIFVSILGERSQMVDPSFPVKANNKEK